MPNQITTIDRLLTFERVWACWLDIKTGSVYSHDPERDKPYPKPNSGLHTKDAYGMSVQSFGELPNNEQQRYLKRALNNVKKGGDKYSLARIIKQDKVDGTKRETYMMSLAYQIICCTIYETLSERIEPYLLKEQIAYRTGLKRYDPSMGGYSTKSMEHTFGRIKQAIENGYHIVATLDIVKAFDNIKHKQIRDNLKKIGSTDLEINIIISLLGLIREDGKRVPTPGCGQGNKLSGLLFNLCIAPLLRKRTKGVVVFAYADDFLFLSRDKSTLNIELDRFKDKLPANGLSANMGKQAIIDLSHSNEDKGCVLEFLKKEISIEVGKVLIQNKDKSPLIIGDKNRGNDLNDHYSLLSSISIDTFLDGETLEKIMYSYRDNHICSYITERNDPISIMDTVSSLLPLGNIHSRDTIDIQINTNGIIGCISPITHTNLGFNFKTDGNWAVGIRDCTVPDTDTVVLPFIECSMKDPRAIKKIKEDLHTFRHQSLNRQREIRCIVSFKDFGMLPTRKETDRFIEYYQAISRLITNLRYSCVLVLIPKHRSDLSLLPKCFGNGENRSDDYWRLVQGPLYGECIPDSLKNFDGTLLDPSTDIREYQVLQHLLIRKGKRKWREARLEEGIQVTAFSKKIKYPCKANQYDPKVFGGFAVGFDYTHLDKVHTGRLQGAKSTRNFANPTTSTANVLVELFNKIKYSKTKHKTIHIRVADDLLASAIQEGIERKALSLKERKQTRTHKCSNSYEIHKQLTSLQNAIIDMDFVFVLHRAKENTDDRYVWEDKDDFVHTKSVTVQHIVETALLLEQEKEAQSHRKAERKLQKDYEQVF